MGGGGSGERGLRGLVLGGGRHLTLGTGSREPGRKVPASQTSPTLSNLSQEASKSTRGLKDLIIAKQKIPTEVIAPLKI